MIGIVFDKLMQYQIVDPSDIIDWSFHGFAKASGRNDLGSIGVRQWDVLKPALDKAIGRVAIAQQRVQTLQKEEEDAKAKATAGAVDDMDVNNGTRDSTGIVEHCVHP
jgi:nuclear cap-binding protein subunit 1